MNRQRETLAEKSERLRKEEEENTRVHEWLRREMEAEDARLRVTPEDIAAMGIAGSDLTYSFSVDGTGSVKLRVPRDAKCCAYAHFDQVDMDKLAPYLLYGFQREGWLQPYLGGGRGLGGKAYWSLPRKLLGVDDPTYRVRYLNGNVLDNRRCNLATCKVGQFPSFPYGPGWLTMRRRARTRSGGICELCCKQPATDVHHCIPVKFFKCPTDAHFLPNLLDLCAECHRIEHQKMPMEMPLLYGLTLPASRKLL
jgi:hypothetical protein